MDGRFAPGVDRHGAAGNRNRSASARAKRHGQSRGSSRGESDPLARLEGNTDQWTEVDRLNPARHHEACRNLRRRRHGWEEKAPHPANDTHFLARWQCPDIELPGPVGSDLRVQRELKEPSCLSGIDYSLNASENGRRMDSL